jgi:hypothetical protein
MQEQHKRPSSEPEWNKLDPLIHLVEIVLTPDIIQSVSLIVDQLQDGRQFDWSAVPGEYPNSKDLIHVDVEHQFRFVKC